MRRFVLFAAQATDLQEVVCQLGAESGIGIKKLYDIIRNPFSIDSGSRPYPVSFQKVIIPIITLVTNHRFTCMPYVYDFVLYLPSHFLV